MGRGVVRRAPGARASPEERRVKVFMKGEGLTRGGILFRAKLFAKGKDFTKGEIL